jgi:tetratricopeptide (TPR) repeat protein
MKRIALGLAALVVLFLLARAILDAVWSAEFEREIQALKASGAKLRLKDFAPPPVAAQDNAAPLYVEAYAKSQKLLENDAPCGRVLDSSDYRRQPPETARAWIDAFREPLALLREASKKPACRFEIDYSMGFDTLLTHLTESIFLAKLLVAKADIYARAGEYDEAADAVRDILALARAINEPFLVSQLIRVVLVQLAVQSLQQNPLQLSNDRWLELAREFDVPRLREDFLLSLEAERALAISTFADMPAQMTKYHHSAEWALMWPIRPILKKDAAEYVRRSTRLIELARLDFATARPEEERLAKEQPWYAPLSSSLVPMTAPCHESHTAALAELSIARKACELKADGSVPDTCELADPFTGKPMTYRREGEGFVFECAGPKDRPVRVKIEK